MNTGSTIRMHDQERLMLLLLLLDPFITYS
jgi:hypothetical protein